eukprot:TRINITY_DN5398_c0_g1_i1.p1 TRINITY_DN5398_c0_g1~~TRINITY_DN5398_c0_g1_i1.p1  ORF type:complete len:199 (+),score=24.32 TRINITY_DN5398_c0_g1_i1:19-615(+)
MINAAKASGLVLLLVQLFHGSADGLFFPAVAAPAAATATAGAAGTATLVGATVGGAAAAPALIGLAGAAVGAGLLGALALSAVGRSRGRGRGRGRRFRGRREAALDAETYYIRRIQELEPEECMKKMVCILAATNQSSNPILNAFDSNLEEFSFEKDAVMDGFEYRVAAKVGFLLKDQRKCDLKYKCSVDTQTLMKFS